MASIRILFFSTQCAFFILSLYSFWISYDLWDWRCLLIAIYTLHLSIYYYGLGTKYQKMFIEEINEIMKNDLYSQANRRMKRAMIRSLKKHTK